MKHETLILKMLFAATLAVSAGLMASMLNTQYHAVVLAGPAKQAPSASPAPATAGLHHLDCPLAADDVICLRAG